VVPFSVLDLSPIVAGGDAALALGNSRNLARYAETFGYSRFWLAEHHNMPGIASAATAVVIGYVAEATSRIRVGAGGVMLPNHSPLVIAEQFGTLAALYPGRIDLGLGRAPGSDHATARALRRGASADGADTFPRDVAELLAYFRPPQDDQTVRAIPGAGLDVPIWLLGSSMFSAQLAAAVGLPFAFASHFAPEYLLAAIRFYRANFRRSAALDRPYVLLGLNVFAAETDDKAAHLFTSLQQAFLDLRFGRPGTLPAPIESMDGVWSPMQRQVVDDALACSVIGSPETVRSGIESFVAQTHADELLITAQIFDHAARVRSFEITAAAMRMLPERTNSHLEFAEQR